MNKTGRKLLGLFLTLSMVLGLMPGICLTAYAQDDGTSGFYAVYNEDSGMLHGEGDTHITLVRAHELTFIYSPSGIPRYKKHDASQWQDATKCWKLPESVTSADDVPWKEVLNAGGVQVVRFEWSDNRRKMRPHSMNSWFAGATDLTTILNPEYIDTSQVTDFTDTFAGVASGASSYIEFNLESWDTSAATSMDHMFAGATGLTKIEIGEKFSSASLLSARGMFEGCTSLSGDFTLPSTFTLDKATTLDRLFAGCTGLTSVIFPKGFTAKSATTIKELFSGCTNLKRIDLGNFSPASGTNTENMFAGVNSLNEFKLGANSSRLVALPDTPAYWRFDSRIVPEGEAEDATLTYPVGSILSPGELKECWDCKATAGKWVAYTDHDSDIVVDYHVSGGNNGTPALIQWAGTETRPVAIDLSDGKGFSHARGVHQTGWTTEEPSTVFEPGMAHVEPTYALGAKVKPEESMTLYATYDANEFTVDEPKPVTYDGTDHTSELVLTAWDGTAVAKDEVDITWTDAAGKPVSAPVECGTYTATVTPRADGNFAYASSKTVSLTVHTVNSGGSGSSGGSSYSGGTNNSAGSDTSSDSSDKIDATKDPSEGKTPAGKEETSTTTAADGSTTETSKVTNTDGSTTEKEKVTSTDGTISDKTTVTEKDGTVKTQETTESKDGSKVETASEIKPNGDFETKTVTTDKDGKIKEVVETKSTDETGVVTETKDIVKSNGTSTEQTVVTQPGGDYKSETVQKDASGEVTKTVTETKSTNEKTGNVTLQTETVKASGASESSKVVSDSKGNLTKASVTETTSKGQSATVDLKTDKNGNVVVKNIDSTKPTVTIPEKVVDVDGNTHDVKAITAKALSGESKVKTLVVKKNVEVFEKDALKNSGVKTLKLDNVPKFEKDSLKTGTKLTIIVHTKAQAKAVERQLKKAGASNAKVKVVKKK